MQANTAQSNKRICSSYTDAYLNTINGFNKRYYQALFLFSVLISLLFQARLTLSTSIISMSTVTYTFLLFFCGLAISTIRNMTFTVFEPVYPSYLAELMTVWSSLDNLILFALHSFFSTFIIRWYFSLTGEKYTNEFLLQPPGHYLGARQLNQEHIFIIVYSVILAFNYTFQYVMKRFYVVKMNNVQQPLHYEIKTSLATLFCKSAMRAIYSFGNAFCIFIVFNGFIYYFMARFFGIYHKVLDSPIIGFSWLDIHLFLRLIMAGTVAAFTFNITNRLYDAIYSMTPRITDHYANPFDLLVDGLQQEKIKAKIAAFSELAEISCKEPEKRAMLFNTIGKDLKENAWYKIMVECTNVIYTLRKNIDIEYNGIQEATKPIQVAKPLNEPQQIYNKLEYSTEDIFTKQRKTYSDLDDRTCNIFAQQLDYDIPVENYKIPSVDTSYIIKLIKEIELHVNHMGSFKSIYSETLTRRIQTVFNQYQLIVLAIKSLGSLTAASLKEDPYGYVQNDISNVLNQLLGCLTDVEKYIKSPPAKYNQLLNEHVKVQECEAVIMALNEAIYQVRNSFNDYLEAFNIDRKYMNKWQRFINYEE